MIRIAITAAAYAAIKDTFPPARTRRYAPQKIGGGLTWSACPMTPWTSWPPCAGRARASAT
jgi:hypothetical protein